MGNGAECKTLDCLIDTWPDESPLTLETKNEEQMWECVRDEFVKSGGTEKKLKKLANVGFIAEPAGYKRFMNDVAALELQEKLEFAYNDPKYYHCLVENDYPVPYAMSDFDPNTLTDDQLRFEIDFAIDKIKADSGSKEEMDRKIYDWSLKALKYGGDCKIEAADQEALLQKCGACTESTAAMFYAYNRAGSKPQIFYWHDLKPSLEWIDMMPKLGEAMDHVFIGIPQKDGSFLHVDRIRKIYDAKYEFAVPFSPRHFVSEAWLNNKRNNLLAIQRFDISEQVDLAIISIAPESFASYFSLLTLYRSQNRAKDYATLLQTVQRNFTDNPWAVFLSTAIDLEKQVAEAGARLHPSALQQKENEANIKLTKLGLELERQSPYLAAQANYAYGRAMLPLFMQYFSAVKSAKDKGVNIDANVGAQLDQLKDRILFHYSESISFDPNYLFAFKDIDALLTETASYEKAVHIYEKLLEKYPTHEPLIYGLAKFYILWANSSPVGKQEKIDKAITLTEILIAGEPSHPKPYSLQGTAYFALGDFNKVSALYEKSIALHKERGEEVPKENYAALVFAYMFLADKDNAVRVIDTMSHDHNAGGLAFISEHLFKTFALQYSISTNSATIADDFAEWGESDKANVEKIKEVLSISDLILDEIKHGGDEAKDNVDYVRGYSLPFVALFDGVEAAKRWMDNIGNKHSHKAQIGLGRGLDQISVFLLSTKIMVSKEVVDVLNVILDMEESVLLNAGKDSALKMKAGLYRGYIMHEDREKAKELLNDLVAGGSPFSLLPLQAMGDLLINGGGTKKNTKRLVLAMNLMYEHIDHFAPEVRRNLLRCYLELADLCRQNGMDEEANNALKRSKELK